MKVDKVMDLIILSSLENGKKSGREVQLHSGLDKSLTRKSLKDLKRHGLVSKKRVGTAHVYHITHRGANEVDNLRKVWARS